jgi:signal transduction histidine kinase
MSGIDPAWQSFFALLTHELRNPVGAISGYQELLADGLYGEIEAGGREALDRIGNASAQLLSLLDGVNELIRPGSALSPDMLYVPPDEIIARAISSAQQLASGRGATLIVPSIDSLAPIRTDPERLARALDLALGAAVRGSPGATMTLTLTRDADSVHEMLVRGTALDLERDDPALEIAPAVSGESARRAISTGPGLRLAMAKRLARSIGADVDLLPDDGSTTLRMRLGGSVGIDAREAAP